MRRAYDLWSKASNLVFRNEAQHGCNILTNQDLDNAFDYHYHLKNVDTVFERVGLNKKEV